MFIIEEKTNIHIDKARLFNNFFNSVFEEDQVVVSHWIWIRFTMSCHLLSLEKLVVQTKFEQDCWKNVHIIQRFIGMGMFPKHVEIRRYGTRA